MHRCWKFEKEGRRREGGDWDAIDAIQEVKAKSRQWQAAREIPSPFAFSLIAGFRLFERKGSGCKFSSFDRLAICLNDISYSAKKGKSIGAV